MLVYVSRRFSILYTRCLDLSLGKCLPKFKSFLDKIFTEFVWPNCKCSAELNGNHVGGSNWCFEIKRGLKHRNLR